MSPDTATALAAACSLLVAIITQAAFVYVQRLGSKHQRETETQRRTREDTLTATLIEQLRADVAFANQRTDQAVREKEHADRRVLELERLLLLLGHAAPPTSFIPPPAALPAPERNS